MVGQRFCERLVEHGASQRYEIIVVAEEATPAYDRVHLTDIWRGRDPRELMLREPGWYREHAVELRLGQRVREPDRQAKTVITESGTTIPYDKLVFATGSRAELPELRLENGAELSPYRTLEDAQRILSRVRKAPRGSKVVTIGGGLLGLEAARTLQQLGCDVLVLEGAAQLLPRQLDHDAARELADAFARAGIALRLRARITGISARDGLLRIEMDGAPPIHAGVVVAAAGARASD
jgi:nitrite reductase (NADH) large subunit